MDAHSHSRIDGSQLANGAKWTMEKSDITVLAWQLAEKEDDERPEESATPSPFQVGNRHVRLAYAQQCPDWLYHLGLLVDPQTTPEMFGDVRYVCCLQSLQMHMPVGYAMADICGGHARYALFKAGPVLAVSHGMGNPSLSIMLHEVLKLLQYARAKRPVTVIRLGTCGGIDVPPGTTIITEKVFNGLLEHYYEQYVLGRAVRHPAILDAGLRARLLEVAGQPDMDVPVVAGNTLCANDFYEDQARLDGAFCDFDAQQRLDFLTHCATAHGIRNIEMESLCFAAMTHRAGLRAAVVCVALLNRLTSDKVTGDVEVHFEEWQRRPLRLVARLIAQELAGVPAAESPPIVAEAQLQALRAAVSSVAVGPAAGGVPGKGQLVPEAEPVPAHLDSGHESPVLDPASPARGLSPTRLI
ncbi:uridine and thymidine phosphorylase-like isoform X2 [Paramacrobiotus metropolitanus]|uniref:uridine and thymidine phosphorylase-like isoform X2 n=1 Tax=Paramacrobiotus metropolitanus TaxID=2943436 RepID=UPI00244637BF|nr:uridine and thymidine phosphorylase-like isoform X2 [Paramacrobiotus metropolitanus]